MRRVLPLALLASIALPVAGMAGEREPPAPLVEVDRADGAERLRLVDPDTLRPASRWIGGFRESFNGVPSPNGRRFAVGSSFGRRAAIRVIDLAKQRAGRLIELGRRGPVLVAWPERDRIIALTGASSSPQELLVVDPFAGRVRARHRFRGRLLTHAATPTGLALLLARERGLGPARLLVGDTSGTIRSITLKRIEAGGNEGRKRGVRYRQPALTIDPTGHRAYVVAAQDRPLVAAVDLATRGVDYRLPAQAPSARAAKGNVQIWWRDATWVGSDAIAVTGFHTRPARRRERFPVPDEPYGVRLIDTSDWSVRTLAEGANQIAVAGSRLLAHGTSWSRGWRRSTSTGLLGFDDQGRRLFHRFRGKDVLVGGASAARAYVWVRPTRTLHVLDLADGHTLRKKRVRPRDVPLLLPAP